VSHTCRLFAPAKINLYLHVTGQRADGYHLLDSLVVFAAGIGDWVTVKPSIGLSFKVTGTQSAALADTARADNLVVRAAQALATAAGRQLDCAIELEKNLPLASGIGGGSSDAATTLLALCQFWQLDKTTVPLEKIARRLGQDVVACLYRRACYFQGIGDQIILAPAVPQAALVLVNPQVHVPTPAVFQARQGGFSPAAPLEPHPESLPALVTALQQNHNDLYAPAAQLAPVIAACLAAVTSSPECLFAAMSGSGATCFGLYADDEAAAQAVAQLRTNHPTWWVAQGRLPFVEE
jgi:4-diphosphocytidyl-2-C-methyl-D-erythritol kinase